MGFAKLCFGMILLFCTQLSRAETVKLCVEHWPPYTVVKDGKVLGGSTVELVREALRRKGHTLEVDYLPFARCLEMVKQGLRDAVADASASQTGEYAMTVGKHMTSLWSLAIWVREDDPIKTYTNLEALRDKRVGLVESYDYPDSIKNFKGWRVDHSTTDLMNVTKLEAHRTDIVVSDIINTAAVVKDGKIKVRYILPPIVSDPLYVAFTIKKPHIRDQFDAALGEMIKDGAADRIYLATVGSKYSSLNRGESVPEAPKEKPARGKSP